jgi:uncharacterized protein (TIGR04255 family)
MQLPTRITPDSITEAVVEVQYLSSTSFEVLIGIFYQAFDKSYTYTNRPLQQPNMLPALPAKRGQEITIQLGSQSIIYNDKVSISFMPNAFVFNCLNQYIGWHDYRPEVEKALKVLWSTGQIKQWTRVGLRYVTQYPQKELKDCIKFNFTFGFPEVQSVTTAFKSEFEYKNARVVLNLHDKLPVVRQQHPGKHPEITPTSVIDIDVIADRLNIDNLDDLLIVMEDIHLKEKEVYFGMLKPEFLETLNPEY